MRPCVVCTRLGQPMLAICDDCSDADIARAKAEGAAEATERAAKLADAEAETEATGGNGQPHTVALATAERIAAAIRGPNVAPKDEALREKLAALAHEQWSGWMRYLFEKCEYQPDDRNINGPDLCIVPEWAVERWNRQLFTPYEKLSEEEKESDRKEADRVLALLPPAPDEAREKVLVEALRSECDAFDYHIETGGKTQPGYTQDVWQRNRDAIRGMSPENDPAIKADTACPTCRGEGRYLAGNSVWPCPNGCRRPLLEPKP